MKLYGSQTSPYVRRIRLLLADTAYDFIKLDIFSAADRDTLAALNPNQKIITIEGGFAGIGRNKKLKEDFNRDYWMGAEESVKYGIVDGILDSI